MLDVMIRKSAVFIGDVGLLVLHAVSLLKTPWFVAAFAAVGIYWAVFMYKAAPPLPQAGPGQYLPRPAPAPIPPASQSPTVNLPGPGPVPTPSAPQAPPVPPRIGRVITPDMMPPAQPVIPDRSFATMSDSPDPYPYRSRRLNLD